MFGVGKHIYKKHECMCIWYVISLTLKDSFHNIFKKTLPKILKELCVQQFSTYWTFFILSYILGTKYLALAFKGAEDKKRWPLFCKELISAASIIRTVVFCLLVCLLVSSQPSFPCHHKWMWEKEKQRWNQWMRAKNLEGLRCY